MKRLIPNFITLLNLLCGSVGIVMVLQGKPMIGSYMIWLAGVFDFLDGTLARLLNVRSEIGKQLDSLADLISFGLLPALIIYDQINQRTELQWLPFIALIVVLFSALRLARFNIDTKQSEEFIGLPTPASALFISALPVLMADNMFYIESWISSEVLIVVALVISLLLVAPITLMSLKFKDFSWKRNAGRYVLIASCLAIIIYWGPGSMPLIILLYIFVSLVSPKIQSKSISK